MEILPKDAEEYCAQLYQGIWLQCAYEVVTNNKVRPYVFAAALPNLIKHRPGKIGNIMIIVPANCGEKV